MLKKINTSFFSNLSYYGRPKNWFSLIYMAFLSGAPFIISMYLNSSSAPLDDMHLYRKDYKDFDDQNDFINKTFYNNELLKIGIGLNEHGNKTIKSNAKIFNDIQTILHNILHFDKVSNITPCKSTVQTKGKGYVLKKKFKQLIYNVSNDEKYLTAYNFKKSDNDRYLNHANISGVVIQLDNNQYIDIKLPNIKLNEKCFLIYENNELIYNNNISDQLKQQLYTYLQEIHKLTPNNVKKIIIANNIVYGDFNSRCDILYQNDVKIINYKYENSSALNINNPILNQYINDEYTRYNNLIRIIDIIYLLLNNNVKISDISELFDVIDIEYDVHIRKNCMLEVNKPSLIHMEFYGDVIYIPSSIKMQTKNEQLNINVIPDWFDRVKSYFINMEMNKVYEIR